jgi:peptide/nickel transport system permease protein
MSGAGRFLRRPLVITGLVIVGVFVLVAIFAPVIAPYGPRSSGGSDAAVFQAPSAKHLLGTDDIGGDVFSELLYGARISLLVAFVATLISVFVGGAIGTIAGYFGGRVDGALMRITDYFLVLPDLALMIVLAAVFGPSLRNIILVIGLLRWTSTARVVRAQVKTVRERGFVKRAASLGAGHAHILRRHVIPQVGTLIMANTVLTIAIAIFNETNLSFLGLGDPSAVSWGTMLHFAFTSAAISSGAWWFIVPPGVAIILVVVACSMVGQAIEDSLNPRLGVEHVSTRRFRVLPAPAVPSPVSGD